MYLTSAALMYLTSAALMYLTSAALTNLQSYLLRSASSYIASKVSAIASLTLLVVSAQLLGWGWYYAQENLSGPLVSQLLRNHRRPNMEYKHMQNAREQAVYAAAMKGCARK